MISSFEPIDAPVLEEEAEVRPAEWIPLDEPVEDEPEPEPETEAEAGPDPTAEAHRLELEEAYRRGEAAGLERGREEGRAEAEEAARREAAERLAASHRALEAALDAVEAAEAPALRALEKNIVALAVAVARHVIGREVKGDARAIAELVRRAIAEFPIDQPLRVRLNPGDLSTISAAVSPDGEPLAIAPGRNLRWVADPRIESGGCMVEGREQIVDGRVDRALERIYKAMIDD